MSLHDTKPFVDLLTKIQEDAASQRYGQIEAHTQAIMELEKNEESQSSSSSSNPTEDSFDSIKEIAKLWLALGELQFGSETMDEQALSSFEKSISNDATRGRSHFFKGLVLSVLGRLEDALAAFEQATVWNLKRLPFGMRKEDVSLQWHQLVHRLYYL
ncbi:hypothetical protein C9374_006294 [Naegleria lovaniensis]|uniref:Uncharacterized protein n=1 Tax=Naegleria lovaniensis TaxID=51637 RepID=A0AA88KJ94_NAELO|nr:uncharacterized protein C9374_006294 [Naegleria lovaniensis]KAG2381305.1 hypothetical protein C9374_006294 [Naegleria lovaniensis]